MLFNLQEAKEKLFQQNLKTRIFMFFFFKNYGLVILSDFFRCLLKGPP